MGGRFPYNIWGCSFRIQNSELYIYLEWDLQVTEWNQIWRPWRLWVTSVSVPLRGHKKFTCYVKTAQGDGNQRNSGPPCPPYLAFCPVESVTGRSHSHVYMYGAHWSKVPLKAVHPTPNLNLPPTLLQTSPLIVLREILDAHLCVSIFLNDCHLGVREEFFI